MTNAMTGKEGHTAGLADLAAALKTYDDALGACPLNSRSERIRMASREVCAVCGADQSRRCGNDNPHPVIEAARAAIAKARPTPSEEKVG